MQFVLSLGCVGVGQNVQFAPQLACLSEAIGVAAIEPDGALTWLLVAVLLTNLLAATQGAHLAAAGRLPEPSHTAKKSGVSSRDDAVPGGCMEMTPESLGQTAVAQAGYVLAGSGLQLLYARCSGCVQPV